MGGMIRNIAQTAQEREINKTAPDIVVYIDGLPYLINTFLETSAQNPFVLVNFNEHVTGFNCSWGTEILVPTASINLSVPNHLKYLYQSPGGNNLLETMMEIQVYAKGYYLANNGNTLYRRVFKGLISHISMTDNGKSLEISLSCAGILHFLERMQVDIHPSAQTNSQFNATPFTTVFGNLNPYQQIVAMFLTSIYTDGFQKPTVNRVVSVNNVGNSNLERNSAYFDAIKEGYIAKWQAISQRLGQDVHIFGVTDTTVKSTIDAINALTIRSAVQGTQSLSYLAEQNVYQGAQNEVDQANSINVDAIRTHLPDHGQATFQTINGQIVNRLERLRHLINMIYYEGYQDIDGQIIIKPPLYNLDVTVLSSNANGNAAQLFAQNHPNTDINDRNNPFIINLTEIRTEHETEDQAAVQATRMVMQGSYLTTQTVNGGENVKCVVEYVDVAKLAQFGLREEPLRPVNWYRDGDTLALFGLAASELNKANRGYRTYEVTIPARPELKLGFPVYIPHRDMYGYIHTISMNYQMAGDATMTLHLDLLRKRPMFPRDRTDSNGNKVGTIYASQPNLIHSWTQPPSTTSTTTPSSGNSSSLSDPNTPTLVGNDESLTKADATATIPVIETTSIPSSGEFIEPGVPPTPGNPQPVPYITNDQVSVINLLQGRGQYLSMKVDTKTNNWRVQNDDGGLFATPADNSAVLVDNDYFQVLFEGNMPFTDGKGYEVVAPFPWGRYTDLKTALWEFTELGYIENTAQNNDVPLTQQNVQAFLFAGLETPSASGSTSASDLTNALNNLKTLSSGATPQSNRTVIELAYTTTGSQTTSDSSLLTQPQPDNNQTIDKQLVQNTDSVEQAKINVFITGKSSVSVTSSQDALAIKSTPTLDETGQPVND